MLYLYKVHNDLYDDILIKTFAGNITEQIFRKNNQEVKKIMIHWEIENGRINNCNVDHVDIVVVPPEMDTRFRIGCIHSGAFQRCHPDLVIVLGRERVTLEKGAFVDVQQAIVYSYLKRSEIPDNVLAVGRTLEDVCK